MPSILRTTARALGRSRVQFGLLVASWVIAAAVLFYGAYNLQYAMTNIDGISYIRIAEHYFEGRLDDAINAYWSPMISWSMLPFMAAGVASQAAFVAASAAWSVVGIVVGSWFVWRRTSGNLFATVALELTLCALYAGNLMNLTPDLLSVTWSMIFVATLSAVNDRLAEGTIRSRIAWGVALGAVLALGYFVKAFLVPVFVVVGLGWISVRLILAGRASDTGGRWASVRPLLIAPAAAILAFALVTAPFIGAMSVKYGGLTAGSSFAVNMQGKFEAADGEVENVTSLPAPPNDSAISFGEDRTFQVELRAESAGESQSSLGDKVAYYLDQRLKALPKYLNKITAAAPFAVLVVALFVFLMAFRRLDPRRHPAATLAALTFVVYFLGYAAIVGGEGQGGNLRYYWPLLPLSTMVAALVWPAAWRRVREMKSAWRSALAIALLAIIPIAAVTQHGFNRNYPFSTGRTFGAVTYLLAPPQKPSEQQFAESLRESGVIPEGSKIVAHSGQAIRTLIYAFYMRVQIFGRDEPHDITDPRLQQELRDLGIDFYFLYEPTESETLDVSAWGEVVEVYEMPYSCGSVETGSAPVASEGCRLSIVAVRP